MGVANSAPQEGTAGGPATSAALASGAAGTEIVPVDPEITELMQFTMRMLRPFSVLEHTGHYLGVSGMGTFRLLSKDWDRFVREKVPVVLKCRDPSAVQQIVAKSKRFSILRGIRAPCVMLEDPAPLLAAITASGGTLETLDLKWNNLPGTSIERVLEVLGKATLLKFLRLARNSLAPSLHALTAALPNLPKLTHLCISNNKLGDASADSMEAFLEGLTAVKDLEVLELGSNKLGDAFISRLVGVLPRLTSLRVLQLGGNGLTDKGAQELVQCLAACKLPLRELELDVNGVENGVELASRMGQWEVHCIDLRANNLIKHHAKAIWDGQAARGGTAVLTYTKKARRLNARGYNAGGPPALVYDASTALHDDDTGAATAVAAEASAGGQAGKSGGHGMTTRSRSKR